MTVQQLIDALSTMDATKEVLVCISQSETSFEELNRVEDDTDCIILK